MVDYFLNRRDQVTGVGLWPKNSFFREIQLQISRRRKSQLISYQVVNNPCCGLSVIFCGFISHLIGRETINIPEIFSSVHGFMRKTVIAKSITKYVCDLHFHRQWAQTVYFYST